MTLTANQAEGQASKGVIYAAAGRGVEDWSLRLSSRLTCKPALRVQHLVTVLIHVFAGIDISHRCMQDS